MPTNKSKMGEILHKRTRNSKTWINFDGSYTTEIHGGDVHYEDEDGVMHNINTDLLDEADADLMDEPPAKEGAFDFKVAQRTVKDLKKEGQLNRDNWDFQAPKVPFDAKIPRRFQRGYSIGKGKDKLTFIPVDSSPAEGHADKNCVTYQDVWNDADVCLEIKPNGVKETITLKTDRAPSQFRFEVRGIDNLQELKLAPAWLVDANGTERDVSQEIVSENGKQYVDLTADVSGLTHPIAIDPTVTLTNVTKEVEIGDNGTKDTTSSAFLFGVGNTTGTVYRAFFEIDVSSVPSDAVVTSAQAEFYLKNYDGGPLDTYVHEVESGWTESNISWSSQPSVGPSPLDTQEITNSTDNSYFFYNVAGAVSKWVADSSNNNGLRLSTTESNSYAVSVTPSHGNSEQVPKLSVTYNEPPSEPTVTSPSSGAVWNDEHTVQWEASTDPESDTLTYDVELSTDNKSSWKSIATGVSSTSYTHNFFDEPETTNAYIRIRAYDGTSYSSWSESGAFELNHNYAPSQPSNLAPAGGQTVDRAQVVRFSWTHNDQNTNDPQSKFDFQWRAYGATVWNTVTQQTTNNYYDMPANTMPNDNVEWRIRTYDQDDVPSPYSNVAIVLAGDQPAPPIITSSENVVVANPLITWSASGQVSYTLRLEQAGTEVYSYSGGNEKEHEITLDLTNGTTYELYISVTNTDGLTSGEANQTLNVNYTPPYEPSLELRPSNALGTVRIIPTIPPGDATTPNPVYYSVYRGEKGKQRIRLVDKLDPAYEYTDFTPQSGVEYEYHIVVMGDNGAVTNSDTYRAQITLKNAVLMLVSDPSKYVVLDMVTGASQSLSKPRTLRQFAGRNKPVAYFGASTSLNIDTSFLIRGDPAMQVLRDLSISEEVLLYRDERGRKAFITLAGVSEEDVVGNNYYRVELSPGEVDYSEWDLPFTKQDYFFLNPYQTVESKEE